MMQSYSSYGLKEIPFILSDGSDFYMIDKLSIAFHTFTKLMLISLSVDEMLLLRYKNWPTNFSLAT